MPHQPPKWVDRLLEWYCDPYLLEDLQGDLYEIFEEDLQVGHPTKAKLKYIWLVLRSFRLSAIKKNQRLNNSFIIMTKNNIKIAIRVLWRDKFNSAINLLGLTLGITCFLLLGLYVTQELSYDQQHSKKDRIYRTWLKEDYGDGREFFNSHTPLRFESLLEENFPEVEKAVQFMRQSLLIGDGENTIQEKVSVISPDFFEVFDFQIINGNLLSPLPTREDIILSEAYAKKYFGEVDPIGKPITVQLDTVSKKFNVSAIFKDIPKESSIQFDMAISTDNSRMLYNDRMFNAWFNIVAETYVLVKSNNQINTVEDKMQDVVLSLMGDADYGGETMKRDQYNIGFQPLTDIHLNPEIPLGFAPVSNPQYVMILAAIGLLVLIMACINYTTLSAGQSLKRSKEVGMRKVLGASKLSLVYQYLSESLVLALFAMIIGSITTVFLIPTFNALTGTEIFYVFQWWHLSICLGVGLIIGLFAGAYPALVITAFKTLDTLRGTNQSSGNLAARKGLVVIQFLVAVFLISTVLIMRDQVNFLMEKDLGINYKAVISARLPVDPNGRGLLHELSSAKQNGDLLKTKLEKHSKISKIAMGSHVFGTNGWMHLAFNDDKDNFKWFRLLAVDSDYLNTFNIEATAGRIFETGNGLDQRQSIILNQAAVDYFEIDNPIGAKLPGSDFGDHQIIGVVDNFHYSSLHSEVEPLIITQNISPIFAGISDVDVTDSPRLKMVFTYSGNNLHDAVELLEKDWESTFPNKALDYNFIDENIRSQYESETRLNKLIVTATVLAIMIAGLGLFGLIMLVANSKIKEIGIRKVMGASPLTIFQLLIRGFVVQLLIAIALSIPLTMGLTNEWLANFAFRLPFSPWPFVLSGATTVLIAGLVVGYHTLRAVKVNPIDSLRTE